MGDTKPYPLPEDAPTTNTFFKPESGPAMKEIDRKRVVPPDWNQPKSGAGKPKESL